MTEMQTEQHAVASVRFSTGSIASPAYPEIFLEAAGLTVRRLDRGDLAAIERHLLELSPCDRIARFMGGRGDAGVSAYARRLEPSNAILLGAFSPSGRLAGFAEARPTRRARSRSP